ncbi:Thiamin-phosphate pyrophosphorylase [Winogradskyella psychrotolerans RS-3]|uniref:Thiamine-phosphate synthase n=1 Tax=Winogradskyella psychrotolerans RS-3 TaxID=641526 RepID=S7VR97_9FLAO|nr:thiamine phosphate synthase [Winogradskyella psychrotolerans]EPR72720.1 Thiamin-phosphate pyrophosphorylase [Winogradskyella psychrotolerans RS-3]
MLSKLHYISQGKTPQDHLENIQKACENGVELVQLRLKEMALDIILETAKKAREVTTQFKVKLIINDHYKIAKAVKADGVHLGKTDACPLKARTYLGKQYLIGGTANTLEDCKVLIEKRVDYIGLGPFQFTETKKNLSPILGIEGYKQLIGTLKTDTPIIAIGGICMEDVSAIINTGVYGIAVSGTITKDFTSISKFYEILNSSEIKA